MAYPLDAELAAALPALPEDDLTDLPAARARRAARLRDAPAPDTTGVTFHPLAVPGPPDVPVRVYSPSGQQGPLPAICDFHGGGFVLGTLDDVHGRALRLCREVNAVVITVDYRLAPEHPYPAAVEDCYAALCWVSEQAGRIGVDPERIALHGQSAGAGLAAAVALLARDRGGPTPCFQYLGVPALDDRLGTASMRDFTDTPAWQRHKSALSWDSYLGKGVPGTRDVSPYAAPARATDLTGLPPAYLTAMQFDPLRDEGIAYARQLLDAGVPVELHLFPGAFHGSVGVAAAEISRRELAEQTAVLRRACHGPAAAVRMR